MNSENAQGCTSGYYQPFGDLQGPALACPDGFWCPSNFICVIPCPYGSLCLLSARESAGSKHCTYPEDYAKRSSALTVYNRSLSACVAPEAAFAGVHSSAELENQTTTLGKPHSTLDMAGVAEEEVCPGAKSLNLCPAGMYCPSSVEAIVCPSGHFCPRGSYEPSSCLGMSGNNGDLARFVCPDQGYVSSTKKTCNSSSLIISAPIALVSGQCNAHCLLP